MKRLRYILACLLSLLIIYTGAGVSIIHYCCNQCQTGKTCCDSICHCCDKPDCHKSDEHGSSSCDDEGCWVSIHKVDLVSHSFEELLSAVSVPVFYLDSSILLPFLTYEKEKVLSYPDPSPPKSVNSSLALYATFLI
ncbi:MULTISPECIES: hypothetical protein [Bacteroides]|uniref:hypothetical protein n=1 Tax=Bacteroides TaxID=816 RepID=UPI0005A5EA22|nr:hypothetical protein [Bacteroides neonati]